MSTLPYNFEAFLIKNLQVGNVTLKNYRADLANFLVWAKAYLLLKGINTVTDNQIIPQFSLFMVEEYVNSQLATNTPPATINRRLSTLRIFGRYLVFSGYIKDNPLSNLNNLANPKAKLTNYLQEFANLLNEFETFLRLEGISRTTVKNYLSDIRQFLLRLGNEYPSGEGKPLDKATLEFINTYKEDLNSSKSTLTLKRTASSLKKFFTWAQKTGHASSNPLRVVVEAPLPVIPRAIPAIQTVSTQIEPQALVAPMPNLVLPVVARSSSRYLLIFASIISILNVVLIVSGVFFFLKTEKLQKTTKDTSKTQSAQNNASILGVSSFKRNRYPLPAPGITFGDLLKKYEDAPTP